MKKSLQAEVIILSVIFISIAAIFLQVHRYFVAEEAAFYPAKEVSSDRVSVKFDNRIMKNIRYVVKNNVLLSVLNNSPFKNTELNEFYIDQCEVRQGEYYQFVKWFEKKQNSPNRHKNEPPNHPYSSSSETHKILYRPENPATGISFYNAHAYCKSAGGRLPASDEWEAAAGGKEGNIYPWGNTFTDSAWKNPEPVYNVAVKCGQFPGTNTQSGIEDMGSGVSEWTVKNNDGSRDTYISGGNAFHKPFEIFAMRFVKQKADEKIRDQFVGFRCVYDRPIQNTPWGNEIKTVLVESGKYPLGVPEDSITPLLLNGLEENTKKEIVLMREIYGKMLNPLPFRFSKNEATVWEFLFFLNDPLTALGIYDHPDRPNGHSYEPLEWELQLLRPFSSLYGVDWWTAYAFARSKNGRLPTEDEWNRAYTNEFKTKYPWGDETFKGATIDRFWQSYETTENNRYITDINRKKIVHLAGNVSEWTGSFVYNNGSYEMIIKGGNYILPANNTSSFFFRRMLNPNIRDLSTGIRLVVDVN